jgi:hypothetical protein
MGSPGSQTYRPPGAKEGGVRTGGLLRLAAESIGAHSAWPAVFGTGGPDEESAGRPTNTTAGSTNDT